MPQMYGGESAHGCSVLTAESKEELTKCSRAVDVPRGARQQAARTSGGAPVAVSALLQDHLMGQQCHHAIEQGRHCSRGHCRGQLLASRVDLAGWPHVKEHQRLASSKDKRLSDC